MVIFITKTSLYILYGYRFQGDDEYEREKGLADIQLDQYSQRERYE